MTLGESESTLDRWPQEGHNSCLTFDSLGLPHPHLTLEMLSPLPPHTLLTPLPTVEGVLNCTTMTKEEIASWTSVSFFFFFLQNKTKTWGWPLKLFDSNLPLR